MLAKVKNALRVSASAYDAELTGLINAGAADLKLAGINIHGSALSLNDPLIIRAIITYVRVNFGTPDDYDRLKRSYDEQKAQLITTVKYGGLEGEE